MLYSTLLAMEININCDLGEKSKHHSNKNDPNLLEIVNSKVIEYFKTIKKNNIEGINNLTPSYIN